MPVTARPPQSRMDAPGVSPVFTLALLAAIAFAPAMSLAQTEPATAPTLISPPTPPATASSSLATTAPSPLLPPPTHAATPAPAPTPEVANVSQPFVGRVTADRVYVRSGPGAAYYEMGQLSKGDTVQVVGSRLNWYQISPPNGTFAMVAKDLVEVDSTGQSGTVKADYVNVRAGTALNKNREPSAVLCVIRKGMKLTILGSNEKYYEVAPPEKAYVFVSPQFVRTDSSAEYKVPTLKLPAGATGPTRDTVTGPTTLPAASVEVGPAPSIDNNTPAATDITTSPTQTVVVPPQPSANFNNDAYTQFSDLNKRYQTELQKAPLQRDLDGLLKDYKALATTSNLPPSVAQGTEARISALEKLAAMQRLAKDNAASNDSLAAQQKALQEQYAQAEKAIKDYEQTGPYLAQGRLQTSTAVQGKYALVNPATGRVVAYVDPQADIDIASLLGKYIGVRGNSIKTEGSDVTVIQVKNATLLPAPEITGNGGTR